MRPLKSLVISALLLAAAFTAAQTKATNSVTIVYKDHHEQTVSSSEVSRIDFRSDVLVLNRNGREERIPLNLVSNIEVRESAASDTFGKGHFVGKWKVGLDSNTSRMFEIDLQADGKARKSIDSRRGTWTFVDGTARITWEDGWRDVIAEVGKKYEKRAYAPGKALTDKPDNVTEARRDNNQSI